MATYEFTVYMTGEGDTAEEAWEQVVFDVMVERKIDHETFRERSNDYAGMESYPECKVLDLDLEDA